ncbi:DUF1707 SHOCT-like domain-containing protein [Kitasatospora sp. CB01950]|uniref:DUF1707 SHOCT-like domain-containing protein n=1 Tax=Kitasatospora sp. CB01950 TaxID=1703930 RepID=UPI0009406541|nr:DUF1707 domain-containing protein [Kitasatospora sp. CB01950]
MTASPEDPPRPIGEADRDAGVQRLQDVFTEGHISSEEMDERLTQVLTAKTGGELVSALASLPALNPGSTSRTPGEAHTGAAELPTTGLSPSPSAPTDPG